MKRYIKANTEKPVLDYVIPIWEELEDQSGIKFTIYSKDNDILFENLFLYDDVDSDAIFDSAVDMAILALSQQYELTDEVINTIKET